MFAYPRTNVGDIVVRGEHKFMLTHNTGLWGEAAYAWGSLLLIQVTLTS